VIAATDPISSVATKMSPEFRFAIGDNSVSANSNDSRCKPVFTKFILLKEEVDTAFRPTAFSGAVM
jgi:hypothetical protein